MRARTRWLCLITTLSIVSGCQCFLPVDENDAGQDGGIADGGSDAGRSDAGSDAGTADAGTRDAGTDAGCFQAAQCLGSPQPTSPWCNSAQGDAGFSCIANTCLWECPLVATGRSCIVDQGSYCLRCGDAGTHCPTTTSCGAPTTTSTATVESSSSCTTWPGTSIPFTNVTIMRTASAQCRFILSGAGQSLGELWRLDDGSYLAWFPGFGGWCTGRSAFTGRARSIFSCPACQFVLEDFE